MSEQGSAISASSIKELRERTGVGMAKCKEALEAAKGNMEVAIDILRKAGMASAVKKQGRETKEGVVVAKETGDTVAVCEINAETDFVVKNERFQEFCKNIIDELVVAKPASLEAFLQMPYSKDKSLTIESLRSLIIQLIGENIQVRRLLVLPKVAGHSFGIYSHMGGKILTLVELNAAGCEDLARDIAMHIAAANPEYIAPANVPQEVVEKEREIARSQITGKPANIIDKILDGKIGAFFDIVCLLRQKFVKEDSLTIADLIKKQTQGKGDVTVVRFLRWTIGQ
jgi:elongation factor Ts